MQQRLKIGKSFQVLIEVGYVYKGEQFEQWQVSISTIVCLVSLTGSKKEMKELDERFLAGTVNFGEGCALFIEQVL